MKRLDVITKERRAITESQEHTCNAVHALEFKLSKALSTIATLQAQRITDTTKMDIMSKHLAELLAVRGVTDSRLARLEEHGRGTEAMVEKTVRFVEELGVIPARASKIETSALLAVLPTYAEELAMIEASSTEHYVFSAASSEPGADAGRPSGGSPACASNPSVAQKLTATFSLKLPSLQGISQVVCMTVAVVSIFDVTTRRSSFYLTGYHPGDPPSSLVEVVADHSFAFPRACWLHRAMAIQQGKPTPCVYRELSLTNFGKLACIVWYDLDESRAICVSLSLLAIIVMWILSFCRVPETEHAVHHSDHPLWDSL